MASAAHRRRQLEVGHARATWTPSHIRPFFTAATREADVRSSGLTQIPLSNLGFYGPVRTFGTINIRGSKSPSIRKQQLKIHSINFPNLLG
jgi:hypothetical protein